MGDGEVSTPDDADDESDDDADDVSDADDDGDRDESVPGFGIGGALTGIGGVAYLLRGV